MKILKEENLNEWAKYFRKYNDDHEYGFYHTDHFIDNKHKFEGKYIYMIKNTKNDMMYIGRTNNIVQRLYEHLTQNTNNNFKRDLAKFDKSDFIVKYVIVEDNILGEMQQINYCWRLGLGMYNSVMYKWYEPVNYFVDDIINKEITYPTEMWCRYCYTLKENSKFQKHSHKCRDCVKEHTKEKTRLKRIGKDEKKRIKDYYIDLLIKEFKVDDLEILYEYDSGDIYDVCYDVVFKTPKNKMKIQVIPNDCGIKKMKTKIKSNMEILYYFRDNNLSYKDIKKIINSLV